MFKSSVFALIIVFLLSSSVFAGHPLITDDTGTQGKGNFEIDVKGETSKDKETENNISIKSESLKISTSFVYGIVETVDLSIELPYQWYKIRVNDTEIAKENGITDLSIDLKWRFYENKDGWSFALKPGITLPTGKIDKGLGTGKPTYGITFITTKSLEPITIHFNLGYSYMDYKNQEDKDILRKSIVKSSLAAEIPIINNLKAVAEIGVYTNPEKGTNNHPAFATGGFIYDLSKNFSADAGVRFALNKPETDFTALFGIAIKF